MMLRTSLTMPVAAAMMALSVMATMSCGQQSEPKIVAEAAEVKAGVPAVSATTTWPLARGDRSQTGLSHAKLGDKLTLKWRFKTEGAIKATPIIADGRAFIGSADGSFYAIDLATGNKVWSFSTIDGPLPKDAGKNEKKFNDPIEASACYVDGRVYFGAQDGNFYCLDAKTGKMEWAFETQDKITAAPNFVKSTDGKSTHILVGSNDSRMYCLDAFTGKKIWQYETGNIINGAPAVGNGVVIFGGCDGLVHVISVADGKKVSEVEITDYIAATAAVDGDRVFFGHHGNKFIYVDLKEKRIVWQFGQRDFPFMGSPALTKDHVLFGGQDRRVHFISKADGKAKWEFKSRGQFNSSPVIVGERAVIGCDDGRVYMLNLADGSEVWNYEIGQPVAGSPAVIDGLMLIGSDDGSLYAFGDEK